MQGLKGHLLGAVFFLTIVGSFAVYDYLPMPVSVADRTVGVSPSRPEISCEITVPKKYQAFLSSIEFNSKTKRFSAQLELVSDRQIGRPHEVTIFLGLTTAEKPKASSHLHELRVVDPFKYGSRRVMDIGWKSEHFLRFHREPAYQAFAEIMSEELSNRLLFVDRNYLLNSVPLKITGNRVR